MTAKYRVSRILSCMLPGGVLGASMVLASACAVAAADTAADAQVRPPASVADQLQAIRAGVTALATSGAGETAGSAMPSGEGEARLTPTWWGNGGWGRWRFGWGNGGFGWPNWHNWNNWHNGGNYGWNNWGNGWHNFWHNA